jgi:hypothetical protein
MSDIAKWQENNSRYLSAALAWLRLLMRRQAQRESASVPASAHAFSPAAASAQAAEPTLLSRFFGQRSNSRPADVAHRDLKLLPPPVDTASDEEIAKAAEAMREAEAADPPPAMKLLAQRFGLSRFEQETLLLCTAIDLDTSLAAFCNLAQGNLNRPYPTFALALTIFGEPAWEALSPERPLRYWRLIEINQPGAQPLRTSALRADERIVNYLKGLNYLDDRLAPLLVPITQSGAGAGVTIPLPPSQQKAVETIARQIELTAKTERLPIIQLLGGDASSKQLIAWRAAAALGLHLYRLPSEWLPTHAAELETWDACLAMTRPRMDALAQRIEPKADWDDLVLPEAEMKLLRQIAAQVGQRAKVYEEWGFSRKMNRGLGINALFAGESGTGKTMAAEVIANVLRLNLYRIDLSAVVSKYIGETEKNLRRLFDAAEDGGAILFFDEADALFGKRSEVKDSHDRYANIEINYLLQRMEAYRGLAILATNMKRSSISHSPARSNAD